MESVDIVLEEKKVVGFFKKKILMNTSLAYGIFFGFFAERYIVGVSENNVGIMVRFLRYLFVGG